jgi:hypothetical protein
MTGMVVSTYASGHKLNGQVSRKNIIYFSDSFILNERIHEKVNWLEHMEAERNKQPAMDHKPTEHRDIGRTRRRWEDILWDRARQMMMLCIVIYIYTRIFYL